MQPMQRRSRNPFVTEDNDDSLINLDADSWESLELDPGKDGDFYAEDLVPIPLDLDGLYLKCVFSSIKTPFGLDLLLI